MLQVDKSYHLRTYVQSLERNALVSLVVFFIFKAGFFLYYYTMVFKAPENSKRWGVFFSVTMCFITN